MDLERACPNCPAYYCPANPETRGLLEDKREFARERGYPQRILNLLEQVNPVCPVCLEQGSVVPLIYIYPAGNHDSPLEWSPNNERIARQLYRQGRIDAYYIRWIGPCDCCGTRQSTKPFDASGAPRDGISIRDGVLKYETPEQVNGVRDIGGSKKPLPEKRTLPDPKLPRIAQPLCPECAAAAEAINKAEQAHYEALREDVARKRELEDIEEEWVRLHNALVDLYNNLDAGRVSRDAYLKESKRINRREAKLEDRFITLASGPEYKRIKQAIERQRKEAEQALARAQDCEARLCRKPPEDETASEPAVPDDDLAGAPPARHGLKPKLICGRFPPPYWEPCFREIRKYYATAEAHEAAKQAAPSSRAACFKGCDFVHAPWVLADWTRRTALKVIAENRIRELEKAENEKRRAEVQAWFEQARAFWSENNKRINSCNAAEAERRYANCRGGCSGGASGSGALLCAIHPLNGATQYQWLSNLYPPGAPQLAGVPPDTPADKAQREKILDMLRSAERPSGFSGAPPVPSGSRPTPASPGRDPAAPAIDLPRSGFQQDDNRAYPFTADPKGGEVRGPDSRQQ